MKPTKCICNNPDTEFWALIRDEQGDKYLLPLKDAKFCPECGKPLKGESDGQSAD